MSWLYPAELEGISRALRDHHHAVYNPIRVASVKGNVGYAHLPTHRPIIKSPFSLWILPLNRTHNVVLVKKWISCLSACLPACVVFESRHAEVAAGMISLVKVMGMLKHKVFLPSGGLSKPRHDFDWVVSG
jgi:hypothetical protein